MTGFFPGNEEWVRAVRTTMGLHSLHIFLWKIIEEHDFRQVYEAILPTLMQLRSNVFNRDVRRNIRVDDEIVEVAGWQWQLPALMSPPQSIFPWTVDVEKVWPPKYVARPAILPVIEPPPPILQQPQEVPVRAARNRAALQLLRARLLYVRCYSRYTNSFWVYAVNRIGLIRMCYTDFINRLREAGFADDEDAADEVMYCGPLVLFPVICSRLVVE
jgi:hypothetical protein